MRVHQHMHAHEYAHTNTRTRILKSEYTSLMPIPPEMLKQLRSKHAPRPVISICRINYDENIILSRTPDIFYNPSE